ncbi:Fe(3+) dicitrate ABC transporter ATP-binding protein FecE [Rodentibacter haemolyticus]|uniref:Fe(3+) dicitrate ABC transporter ATP-binding protein FecE n=1 Tax=Rodentibacter haemolyticus TaxID=2778911 RepID=A0ABX6UZA0_9PAST|nr:Fe(3+) dicitrate ABC transporter ATP-binding protein FecE [Rodentibacter haemolyticus]QPB42794.1 Fe(3+) dicitrate ABC transporter ATP-binding protein FecE [Rodentibacter haemolyticus]
MTIEIKNLQLSYQDTPIVHHLSLCFPPNKVIGLLGPNGCGKSTTLKAIARLLKPKQGTITYQGKDIWQKTPKEYAKHLAFLPQQHLVPEGISVRELVSYGRSPYVNLWGKLSAKDEELVNRAMLQTHTIELSDKLVADLSGGQQQRVFLAMTLAQDTDIVLLDEPTTYLDLNRQADLMAMMRQMQQDGKTIITVLHDLNQASRYCDYLIIFKEGNLIAQGAPEEVMTKALLKNVFDLEVEIHRDPVSNTPMFILK